MRSSRAGSASSGRVPQSKRDGSSRRLQRGPSLCVRIRYAQQAADGLDAIFDDVLSEDQGAALKLLAEFERRIGGLAESPYVCAAIRTDEPMMIAAGYRYLVVSPYLAFYRVTDSEARIGRVLHSRQDWLPLLFGPR